MASPRGGRFAPPLLLDDLRDQGLGLRPLLLAEEPGRREPGDRVRGHGLGPFLEGPARVGEELADDGRRRGLAGQEVAAHGRVLVEDRLGGRRRVGPAGDPEGLAIEPDRGRLLPRQAERPGGPRQARGVAAQAQGPYRPGRSAGLGLELLPGPAAPWG